MTQHDDQVRLRHMLDHAREAVQLAQGRSRADLDVDRLFNLAMTRLLEIVGEAAGRVTQPTRDQHPDVPWPQIVGLRNRLVPPNPGWPSGASVWSSSKGNTRKKEPRQQNLRVNSGWRKSPRL